MPRMMRVILCGQAMETPQSLNVLRLRTDRETPFYTSNVADTQSIYLQLGVIHLPIPQKPPGLCESWVGRIERGPKASIARSTLNPMVWKLYSHAMSYVLGLTDGHPSTRQTLQIHSEHIRNLASFTYQSHRSLLDLASRGSTGSRGDAWKPSPGAS